VFDRPSTVQAEMFPGVVSGNQQDKVFRPVIKRVVVQVMNVFGFLELTTEVLLHDGAMFVHPSPWVGDLYYPVEQSQPTLFQSGASYGFLRPAAAHHVSLCQ
jgi:hypothetical protein